MKIERWLDGIEERLLKQPLFLIEADRLKVVIRGSKYAPIWPVYGIKPLVSVN